MSLLTGETGDFPAHDKSLMFSDMEGVHRGNFRWRWIIAAAERTEKIGHSPPLVGRSLRSSAQQELGRFVVGPRASRLELARVAPQHDEVIHDGAVVVKIGLTNGRREKPLHAFDASTIGA
jgi:hypothetical protein